jgi:cytochrome b6-f complex iron-sulfur subunit
MSTDDTVSIPAHSTRRDLLAAGLASCAGCLLIGCGSNAGSAPSAFLVANVPTEPVDVGLASALARDGIHDRWADKGFFLVRRNGRLFAPSSICTHKRVLLVVSGSDFACPQHGSVFTSEGELVRAPARKSLPRLAIRMDEQGHVIVDPRTLFEPDRWNDPGASLRI